MGWKANAYGKCDGKIFDNDATNIRAHRDQRDVGISRLTYNRNTASICSARAMLLHNKYKFHKQLLGLVAFCEKKIIFYLFKARSDWHSYVIIINLDRKM